jgi:DICT domain-containing protein
VADLTPEALAGELDAEAARLTAISSPRGTLGETRAHWDVEARAEGLRDSARQVRARLTPAHAALAAERDELRALIVAGQPTLASQVLEAAQVMRVLTAENARFHAALEQVKRTAEYFDHKGELNIAREALEGGQ